MKHDYDPFNATIVFSLICDLDAIEADRNGADGGLERLFKAGLVHTKSDAAYLAWLMRSDKRAAREVERQFLPIGMNGPLRWADGAATISVCVPSVAVLRRAMEYMASVPAPAPYYSVEAKFFPLGTGDVEAVLPPDLWRGWIDVEQASAAA